MAFDPWKYPIAFMSPAYLSAGSAWVTHIPFAFTIVAMARPKTLVELGTYNGDSYLAFCQAVKALGLPTKCTAVDTWMGDVHTGYYGEEVLAMVRAAHDKHYSGFSQLMRADFDTAVKSFEDGSIDLLHIDGLHTYEAVRHDYETWLPKLSAEGVVLFHDTAVTEQDFGVHRLFAELAKEHPAFTFIHGSGLGVVARGARPPEAVVEFLEFASARQAEVEAYFAALGNRAELGRMLMKMSKQVFGVQATINAARRQKGYSVDPKSEAMETLMRYPSDYMDYMGKTLGDLLARTGALPGGGVK